MYGRGTTREADQMVNVPTDPGCLGGDESENTLVDLRQSVTPLLRSSGECQSPRHVNFALSPSRHSSRVAGELPVFAASSSQASRNIYAFEVEMSPSQSMSHKSSRAAAFQRIKDGKRLASDQATITRRTRARLVAMSVWWQAFSSAAILVDLIVLIKFWSDKHISKCIFSALCWYGFLLFGLLVTLVHITDCILGCVAFGLTKNLRRMIFIFDFGIALLSVAAWTALCVMRHADERGPIHTQLVTWLCVLRFLRILRLVRQAAMCPCRKLLLYGISGNRKRFVDVQEDFDLDLTYVTERVIAMSVPINILSQSCFRNLLSDVSRFFDTRHKERYMIVNACPELPYTSSAFQTGRVLRFDIQDHTPPTMEQFLAFIQRSWQFMSKDSANTLGVHCKGGKGRTGSLIVAWLLYTRHCESLEDALACFALARSDFLVSWDIQGVETPSQVRYLAQFHQLCRCQNTYEGAELAIPERIEVRLIGMSWHNIWKKPPPTQLVVAVHQIVGCEPVFDDADFPTDSVGRQGTYSHVVIWSETFDSSQDDVPLVGTLAGNVRVSVFDVQKLERARKSSSSGMAFPGDVRSGTSEVSTSNASMPRIVAGTEPGCLFYFMFHTAFLRQDGSLKVTIGSHEEYHGMDKAWRNNRKYNMDGYIELKCTFAF